jgi:spore maturation protein CgeB
VKIAVIGLSITSSWGNGHATTYRSLLREFNRRGHEILFLERDAPWYAANRDLPSAPFCEVELYGSTQELKRRFDAEVRSADAVIVGSYVPDGTEIGSWVIQNAQGVRAFYDIDTPVTLSQLRRGEAGYISPDLIPKYDLYLSFTGGPVLQTLERSYGAQRARALYCSVDPTVYFAEAAEMAWDLGYLGTYSPDRQPALDSLLLEPARRWAEGRMIVAGPQYPSDMRWPDNVSRQTHLPPNKHRIFYCSQRFTLNLTRTDMKLCGYSPSVRLFEAAACATPIISDNWPGLDSLFEIGSEILIAETTEEVLEHLRELSENQRTAMGLQVQRRVLASHTAAHRAAELEAYIEECRISGLRTTSLPARETA